MHSCVIIICFAFIHAVGSLSPSCDDHSWCYQNCEYDQFKWGALCNSHCGGQSQSPININTTMLTFDSSLGNFNLSFSDPLNMSTLINTGHTVTCMLNDGMTVTGGGLKHDYSTVQLHFHWGTRNQPGSEHTVDHIRYPMEMHIVSLQKGLTEDQAKNKSEGIAVLGFFINETDEEPSAWKNFTSYLNQISKPNTTVKINDTISINDLLGKVDITKFYRYNGSLTTPTCNEVVVWTVFEDPIKISRNQINKFPEITSFQNIYRATQSLNGRHVYASPALMHPTGDSWCYLDSVCEFSTAHWATLPNSHCGGRKQSPINIISDQVTHDASLVSFTFTGFSDQHTISHLLNTGETVRCVLNDGLAEIGGGGLGHQYSTTQIHFHWGNTSDSSFGSEHSVDSHRYPMEMHIVSVLKGLTAEQAAQRPDGYAVLGFFIKPTTSVENGAAGENKTSSWTYLLSHLPHIKEKGSTVPIAAGISINDLLGDVDRSKYYRYNGSLTTPGCDEAVLWTVFQQPITLNKDLIKMFPANMGYYKVYRPLQPLNNRKVYTSDAPNMTSPTAALLLLLLVLHTL